METDGLVLSDDDVRERFSAYHDGELPEPEAAAVRKRLDENAALAAEYDAFRAMLARLAGLGSDTDDAMKPGVPRVERVDLLAGVQARLHKKSGGKFYRNRFSRSAGVLPLELLAAIVLVVLGLVYLCMTYISSLEPARPGVSAPAGGARQP